MKTKGVVTFYIIKKWLDVNLECLQTTNQGLIHFAESNMQRTLTDDERVELLLLYSE